jgi:hypothetical protein
MKRTLVGLVAVAGLLSASGSAPAAAHHAIQAEFDLSKRGEFTGVLTRFAMINPHCRWFFEVKTPGGAPVEWELTAGSPGALRAAGLLRAFKVGDTFRATYAPARNGAKLGRVIDFYFSDGRVITLYHDNPNNPNDL